MNLSEGTRRLALLFGLVGATAGGMAAYHQCLPVWQERAIRDITPVQWRSMLQMERHDALYGMGEWQRNALAKAMGYYNWYDENAAMNAASANPVMPNPPVPSAWNYLWFAIWPMAGFIVTYSAIRAIGWVVAGFMKNPNQP